MKIIKNYKYRDFTITVEFDENSEEFYAFCDGIGGSNAFIGDYETAKKRVEQKIDEFIKKYPKTWDELTQALTEHLVWTHYEQAHVDEDVVKHLVTKFIKYGDYQND